MKHTTPLLLALLLVLSAPAALAIADASLQRYDPTPAQPGDLLTVYVSVTNDEDIARNVQVEILPTSTIIPEGQSRVTAGTLGAYGTYTANFNARVSRDAPAGQAVLRMRVTQEGQEWQERTATITVKAAESAVLIADVQSSPETVEPGKASTITLTLENNAGSLLRDVTTQLDLTETPFVPTGSSTRKKVSELRADQEATVTYQLVAQPDAAANIYRVPVTISFLDEDGETQTDTDTLGLYVGSEPSTTAIVDDVSRTSTGVEVAVRIINKGLSEVKFVEAKLEQSQGYEIPVSERVAYVGNIDSDDWETLRFTLTSQEEQVTVPLSYTFQDAFNNEVTVQKDLQVDIPAQQSQGIGATGVIIILLLIAGAWWFVRRRRKKNKK